MSNWAGEKNVLLVQMPLDVLSALPAVSAVTISPSKCKKWSSTVILTPKNLLTL